MALIPTLGHRRDFTANKQRMWGVFRLIRLVYMICTGMFGNGVAINRTITTMAHQLMEVLGKLEQVIIGWCAAVRGTTIRESVVRLCATAAMCRISSSVTSVFELYVLLRCLTSTL